MIQRISSAFLKIAFTCFLTCAASSLHAQMYTEMGDSGQTPGNEQSAGAIPTNGPLQVGGTFADLNDADLYSFTLSTAATITITSVNSVTQSAANNFEDTELFLLTSTGQAIAANDDDPSGSSSGSTIKITLAAGTYLVGISLAANEPVDAANQLLFAEDNPTTIQRDPNPNAGNLNDFDSNGTADANATYPEPYSINLVPEPAVTGWLALGAGLLAVAMLRRRRARSSAAPVEVMLLAMAGLLTAGVSISSAKPVPDNLGNGLGKLVASNLTLKAAKAAGQKPVTYSGYATREAATYASLALVNPTTHQMMVDIMLDGQVPVTTLLTTLPAKFPLLSVQHKNTTYRGVGVIEGYVAMDDVPKIAATKGVSAVNLVLRPIHSVGEVTDLGVHQHRVDQIDMVYNSAVPVASSYDGTGISVGVMSDSYDESVAEGGSTRASEDVVSGDLPGTGNTTYPQPVVVLEDFNSPTTATDEGRGMCQIVHDIAPAARIGFATADVGEVGFADNIRALAGIPAFVKDATVQLGFKGDVVCDDVSYLDEPIFQDGIVAQGVIDAVNFGATYCSSAANNAGVDGYSSLYRHVNNGSGFTAATNSALVGTNINLAGVDPSLYAGGFHNFNPNGGLDVAQTINSDSDTQFVFQWNDPYDTAAPILTGTIFSGSGNSSGGQATTFGPFRLTAGQEYVFTETATNTSLINNFDGIVSITDPMGKVIVNQDTGTDEVVFFFPPATGSYTVTVTPFSTTAPIIGGSVAPTMGPFTFVVSTANGVSRITQDFNVLFFDSTGAFLSALSDNNFANNRPIELGMPALSASGAQVQMVIARSNTTTPAVAADRFKYIFFGNGLSGVGPAEYGSILTPVTFGHSAAAGANSVAAYSNFRPNIPEDFTSPGPVTIFFDPLSNRLSTPELRLKPDIAANDASNNTFFPLGPTPGVGDSLSDTDTFPNFSGTSAASPHAAAISALVLQAHGGPGKVTPKQMKTVLQNTAFPHDLDPYSASGTAKATNGAKVAVVVNSDNSANTGTGANDPNAITVTYTGPGRLASLVFNPQGTATTGGNVTGGNFIGVTPDQFQNATFFKSTPGMVFTSTFAVGTPAGGLKATALTSHTLTNKAPAPSTSQYWTLNLAFDTTFVGGSVFRFNVGRDQQQDSTAPTGTTTAQASADLLGGGVMIPENPTGANIPAGMTFNGTVLDNNTVYPFAGVLANRISRGYSVLDGYGFLNAQAAVAATLPAP